jgi:putative cell wall-binding protein
MAGSILRGRVAAALILALLLVPLPVLGGVAQAEHFDESEEIVASSGVDGAIAYSQKAFPDGASEALIGRSDLFADSLASATLQDSRPLLLTTSGSLHSRTAGELERLGVTKVTLLGGTKAVSERVESQLRSSGYEVARLSGATRVETAAALAQVAGARGRVFLARAFGSGSDETAAFADSLALAAWAAADKTGILLTNSDTLPKATADYIVANVSNVVVVGGPAAVSETVVSQVRALGASVTRVSGATRFDTAVEIAKARGFEKASEATHVLLVDGQDDDAWADGFAAAAYAGQKDAPILLANSASTSLPAPTSAFLRGALATVLVSGWSAPAAQVDAAAEEMGKALAGTRQYTVPLSWKNVVRTGGDSVPTWGHGQKDKTGTVSLTIDSEAKTIDYDLQSTVTGTYPTTNAFVIRRAAVNARGAAPVVTFPAPDSTGKATGTVGSSALAKDFKIEDLITKPTEFYVEVSTTSFPNGAVRGQLPNGGADALPEDPVFTGIVTNEGDDVITLQFNVPVFAPSGMAPSDFTVLVNEDAQTVGGSSRVEEVLSVATTSSGAVNSLRIRIEHAPAENTTQKVTLTTTGAGKLMNDAGVNPASASRTHMTPNDTVLPVFQSIDVSENSSTVFLNFSEPVHTGAQTVDKSAFQVAAVDHDEAYATTSALTVAKSAKSTRHAITLDTPVAAGKTITVTLVKSTTATKKAEAIVDSAGNQLSSDLSRTGTALVRGLKDATASNIVGKGSVNAAGQFQTLAVTLVTSLPAGSTLTATLPAAESVGYADKEVPLVAGAAGVTGMVEVTQSAQKLLATAASTVPAGARLVFTLRHVEGRVAPADTSTLAVKWQRSDTLETITTTFGPRKGVIVTSVTPLPSGLPTEQVLDLRVAGALADGKKITLDLANVMAAGVSYDTEEGPVLGSSFPSGSNAIWDGSKVVVTLGGPLAEATAASVTVSATAVSGLVSEDRTVSASRDDADSTTFTRRTSIIPSIELLSLPALAYSDGQTLEITFKLHGAAQPPPTNQWNVEFNVSDSRARFTNSVVTATSGTPSMEITATTKKVRWAAPAGGAPNGTQVTLSVSPIDARTALAASVVIYTRSQDSTYSVSTTLTTTGAPDGTLTNAVLAGSTSAGGKFGDDLGEKITFTFTHAIEEAANSVPTVTIGQSDNEYQCGQATPSISCEVAEDKLTMTIMTPVIDDSAKVVKGQGVIGVAGITTTNDGTIGVHDSGMVEVA